MIQMLIYFNDLSSKYDTDLSLNLVCFVYKFKVMYYPDVDGSYIDNSDIVLYHIIILVCSCRLGETGGWLIHFFARKS